MDQNKGKALTAALAQIERQFGKGSVMRMGDQKRERIPAISTGSLGLDVARGPIGRYRIARSFSSLHPQLAANLAVEFRLSIGKCQCPELDIALKVLDDCIERHLRGVS